MPGQRIYQAHQTPLMFENQCYPSSAVPLFKLKYFHKLWSEILLIIVSVLLYFAVCEPVYKQKPEAAAQETVNVQWPIGKASASYIRKDGHYTNVKCNVHVKLVTHGEFFIDEVRDTKKITNGNI